MKEYRYTLFTNKIEKNIKKGILKAGDKLPSIRKTKLEYSLSTSSVQAGYDYLVSKGLVTSIPKSGYIVNESIQTLQAITQKKNTLIIDTQFRENILLTSQKQGYSEFTTLNAATPSDLFIPQKLVLQTMQQVIKDKSATLLRYYPSNGSLELKEQIIKRAAQYEISIEPEELIITDGALQALYIALASITSPNDIIAIESPCIFSILQVIASLKLKVIEIPMLLKDGFDIDYLKKVCAKNSIKAIVVTPNFHNPTGNLLSDHQKKAIYSIAQLHHIPIVENDIYGDLYFGVKRPSTIRSFDSEGLVLTYSSFSKTIAPGLRLGWLATGQFLQQAEQVKFALGRSVSPFNQEVITSLLDNPNFDKHLKTFRKQLKHQAYQLTTTLTSSFSKEFKLTSPQGGYSLWGQLPSTMNSTHFFSICQKEGISFTPGTTFSFTNSYESYFRATFSQQLNTGTLQALNKIGTLIR
ncbi:MAG: PLP-dependent aminotransferase family protein [Flavobacteriaceae bacterium]|jgi:DNA-binding transcriptional MocR family regulator|nr:PLP-dependent aminotransferase family protein [Flavobacteriaceae bacterium]